MEVAGTEGFGMDVCHSLVQGMVPGFGKGSCHSLFRHIPGSGKDGYQGLFHHNIPTYICRHPIHSWNYKFPE